jgi:hypothetical protein
VADDLVVGAHLRLGAQAEGLEVAGGVEQLEHRGRHVLLQGLGGQDVDLLVGEQRRAERRVERRHRLADAGRGLDQQVLAALDRLLHRLDDQLLPGRISR